MVLNYVQKKNLFRNEIAVPGDIIVVPSGVLTIIQ